MESDPGQIKEKKRLATFCYSILLTKNEIEKTNFFKGK